MLDHNDSTYQDQILNWLEIAFTQIGKQPSEEFFYDKRDNQFFSTLLLDYLMFEDDFSLSPGITVSFTNEEILQLSDRLKRISISSPDILPIPKSSKSNMANLNPSDETNISKEIEDFLSINNISLENVSIWETEGKASIKIKLD